MNRADLTDEQYETLLEAIFPVIVEKGPSRMSMDHVASRLGKSKRTLYEIFDSKDNMIQEVFHHQHAVHKKVFEKIFAQTSNAMEGLAKVIAYQQNVFRMLKPAFFRDMDERFKHLRPDFDSRYNKMTHHLEKVLELGIKQGVFRHDIDFQLQLTLLSIQMESLKRMEEKFPPEITLIRAYQGITESFLRSIATPKGLEVLETVVLQSPRHSE
ncbi:MAG: TetR/AcrR family transcriptional regulator [Muribaculaceae bacterium]|nr:TetR/AcrR family transcriptional regulator [Muribaculaceae bacterium]